MLIKSCAQSIPTFAMTCFDLTKGFCEDLNTMICRFWWAQQENEAKTHWLSWETLTRAKEDGGLGYKELHTFNMSMLAKQGWRLLTDPDSLCARVMRARYYPDADMLGAESKPGISYAWRSILRGIQVLKEGLVKRIGNGEDTNIWADMWLPRDDCRKPVTPRGQIVVQKVSELINPLTGNWDAELVRELFWPQDVNTILALPLFEDFEDSWAWHFAGNGQFSVKTAYRMIRDNQHRQARRQVGGASMHVNKFSWGSIWKIQCPARIRHFLWRLAHNSLPRRLSIKRRGMEADTLCPVCQRKDEDGAHIFLQCKHVKPLWRGLQLEQTRVQLLGDQNAKEFVTRILELPEDKRLECITMLWAWWDTRNKKNAGEPLRNTTAVLKRVKNVVQEVKIMGEKDTNSLEQAKWSPPGQNALKINIDGSMNEAQAIGGWGFIVRNSQGEALGARAGHIQHVQNPLQAEAMACFQSLQAAQEWGFSEVHVETDASQLVQALQSNDQDQSINGVLFREIKYFAHLNFNFFRISFCPRACNKVADALARYGAGSGLSSPAVWPDGAPEFVHDLASDIAELFG